MRTPGAPIGAATVRAPGACGELVQGMLDGVHFLITCPIDFFSRVQVTLYNHGPGVDGPFDCPKAVAALNATLAHLGQKDIGAKLTIQNPIPKSKGLGSSSADVAATIAATGLAFGTQLSPETMARIALSVEPSDGVMFPGIALMDHREGLILETLGPPPPMEIVALDFGGTVDTLEFNAVDRHYQWRAIQAEVDEALLLVKAGIEDSDPESVGRGATISARASLRVSPKPMLQPVLDFAEAVGAVGVNVGHSGTIIGVLLDARERRGKSVFRLAKNSFPDAEMVHHFRLWGGGVRPVTPEAEA
jgi:L-threonine kinase